MSSSKETHPPLHTKSCVFNNHWACDRFVCSKKTTTTKTKTPATYCCRRSSCCTTAVLSASSTQTCLDEVKCRLWVRLSFHSPMLILGTVLFSIAGTIGKGKGLNFFMEHFLSNAIGRSLIFILKCQKKSICCIQMSSITTYSEQPAPGHNKGRIRKRWKARFLSKKLPWSQLL